MIMLKTKQTCQIAQTLEVAIDERKEYTGQLNNTKGLENYRSQSKYNRIIPMVMKTNITMVYRVVLSAQIQQHGI